MVYQVCEAGRGLVRQQVGEEIPGAKQRQLSQTDRKTDKPRHIVPTEHDLSHTGVKTNTVHKAVKNKTERLFFPSETTNLFIRPPPSNRRFPAVFLYYQQHFQCQRGLYLTNHPCSCRTIHPSLSSSKTVAFLTYRRCKCSSSHSGPRTLRGPSTAG